MKNNPELKKLTIRLTIFAVLMICVWIFQLYLPKVGDDNYKLDSVEYHEMNARMKDIFDYMLEEGTLKPTAGSIHGWDPSSYQYEDVVVTIEVLGEPEINYFMYKRKLFSHLGYRIDLDISTGGEYLLVETP